MTDSVTDTLPETCEAAVMPAANRPVQVQAFALPDLAPNSALLKVELSEVCGTDVHLQHGRLSGVPYPLIPGHVSVGTLAAIRGQVRDIHGQALQLGERVTFLDVLGTCHQCWYCSVAKASTRCPKRRVYGITMPASESSGSLSGGWSQYLYLRPGTQIIRLASLSARDFMAGGCSLPTALHAIDLARVQIADHVLVLGSGPVGLSTVAFARLQGAGRVSCFGAPSGRLATARSMGADDSLDIFEHSHEQRLSWILDQTRGRGADITIEATGQPEAVQQAMQYTRDNGRVVIVGQYTDNGPVSLHPHHDLNRKHLSVQGCWGSDFSHFYRGLEALSRPRLQGPWRQLHTKTFALRQVNEALSAVSSGQLIKALVDPWL